MNNRLLRGKYTQLSKHINNYLQLNKKLKNLGVVVSDVSSLSGLNQIEATMQDIEDKMQALRELIPVLYSSIISLQGKHTQRNASVTRGINKLVTHFDKPNTITIDLLINGAKKKFSLVEEILEASPNSKELLEKITEKRKLLEIDCDESLAKFKQASSVNMQEYSDFLANSKVKAKYKSNPLFAFRLNKLNKEIILAHAQEIAASNRKLFLNITPDELRSPWEYLKPGKVPNIKAHTAYVNGLSQSIRLEILGEKNMEKRAIILEKWILVAHNLLKEHNDYSGFQAVYSAVAYKTVDRLKKTFASLSSEAQAAYKELEAVAYQRDLMKPVLELRRTAIPNVPMLLSDLTFSYDGDPALEAIEDINLRRKALTAQTTGGMKRMAALTVLQRELRKSPTVNEEMIDHHIAKHQAVELMSDDDEYTLSLDLEPLRNTLEPADVLHLDFNHSISNAGQNKFTNKELLLQALVSQANNYLTQIKKETFDTTNGYIVNRVYEDFRNLQRCEEIATYLSVLKEYSKNLPQGSLLTDATAVIRELAACNIEQIKTDNVIPQASHDLYRVKQSLLSVKKLIQLTRSMLGLPSNTKYIDQKKAEIAAVIAQLKGQQMLINQIASLTVPKPDQIQKTISNLSEELTHALSTLTDLTQLLELKKADCSNATWHRAISVTPFHVSAKRYGLLASCSMEHKQLEQEVVQAETIMMSV